MLPTIKSYYMGIILLATCLVLAHGALESSMATDQFADNPEEKNDDALLAVPNKRPSFFVGSRYGRSGPSGLAASAPIMSSSKSRRLSVVPRNDRFFLGSRYGKRASGDNNLSPYEQAAMESTYFGNNKSEGGGYKQKNSQMSPRTMSCVYMGLKNYYRCSSVEEINDILNEFTNTHTDYENDRK